MTGNPQPSPHLTTAEAVVSNARRHLLTLTQGGRAVRRQLGHDRSTGVDQFSASIGRELSFGPFRLFPAQRLLQKADQPLRLGSRALDILIALVERPGELISKAELIDRVWPNTFVEEENLRVHIATLRKTLGEGQDGHRYIINVPARGYCFVAPIRSSHVL
jgi:DNA-binding winged helix-turn-helix (wHTH) protein